MSNTKKIKMLGSVMAAMERASMLPKANNRNSEYCVGQFENDGVWFGDWGRNDDDQIDESVLTNQPGQ